MPVSRPRAILSAAQIERKADQVVAQRLGHELVDLVADLAGHAAHDGAGRLLRRRAAGGEGERVQEGGDQADLLIVGQVGSDRRRR